MPRDVFALVPILATLAAAVPAAGDELTVLLESVRAAHGGTALADLSGFRARGRVLQVSSGVTGKLRMTVDVRGGMRTEIRYPGRSEVRILSGRLAWNGGRGRQEVASRALTDAMQLQFHRLVAAYELTSAPPEELEVTGSSDEGWIRVSRRWNDRTRTVYEIDDETGRIRRIRGEILNEDGDLVFVSESHDFREVNGVLFPFRTTTMISGKIAVETILDRLTPESEFEPGEFLPTGSPADI